MKIDEAMSLLRDGYKLNHDSFNNDEYIYLDCNEFFTQENTNFDGRELYESMYEDGWKVYKEINNSYSLI